MKKKLKETTISADLLSYFDGKTIEEVTKRVNKYKNDYPQLVNWRFKHEYSYDWPELHLIADRWETDAELATRKKKSEAAIKSNAKRKAKKELAELKLFEELKKKYDEVGK